MKLRPLKEDLANGNDGYRGDIRIAWRLEAGKKGRSVETFGTWCRCGQSWGWTPDPGQAVRLHRAMKKLGCPRCR